VDDPDSVTRALHASEEILEACVALGGSLSGEHGIGSEKRELMNLLFSADDLAQFARLRHAFDPSGLLNPSKILPLGKGCGEARSRRPPLGAMRGSIAGVGAGVDGRAGTPDEAEAPWI
jgi:glycolate oxidase